MQPMQLSITELTGYASSRYCSLLFKAMSSPCLHQAVRSGRLHQIRLLLDIGVKPTIVDNQGRTPLIIAACITKDTLALSIARLLLSRGARADCTDHLGRTALSYACENGHSKLVKLLIDDDDSDINMADKEGNTPLMYAAMSGNAPTLREILHVAVKYRLNVDLRNNKGFSAYLLAAKMAHRECARLLKTEANASVCVRDSEFFLSDKEWAKKAGRNFEIDKDEITVQNTRPKTSLEISRTNENGPRALSRLKTRSESALTPRKIGVVNPWYPCTEEEVGSKCASTLSASGSSSCSTNSEQSSVPFVARTRTPDLHAIFSNYALIDNRPAVTIADRRCPDPTFPKHGDLSAPLKSVIKNSRRRKLSKKKVSISMSCD